MIKTKMLRCLIGVLGMALPIIVVILCLAYGYGFPNSISDTYFIPTCIVPFVMILGFAGFLLVCYRGYTITDNILNTIAGFAAWGVCLFPCGGQIGKIGTFQLDYIISNNIHITVALVFFGILAYNSIFQFTKGSDSPTPQKKKRNVIFRVCGIGMILSFALLPLVGFGVITIPHIWWVVEFFALWFFGISWLTKANCISFLFADKE